MCNEECLKFGARNLTAGEIRDKRVIEIGSLDLNGSLRSVVEPMKPSQYIGVDIVKGKGVDIICKAEDIAKRFGTKSFDVVISTELLEHVIDWRRIVRNIKSVCKPNGIILITTRSRGFKYHPNPTDFWRFEIGDMKDIFSDCVIEKLEKDKSKPGVFLKARKPKDFREKDLSNFKSYSSILNKKVKKIGLNYAYKKILKFDGRGYFAKNKDRVFYTWNRTSKFIKPNSKVLEIGIGPMAVLARKIRNVEVVGVDLNDNKKELCREFGIKLKVCNLESSPIPIKDNSVDTIFLLEVIEHLNIYPNDLFGQLFKKLKKGGHIIVSSMNFIRFSNRVRIFLGKYPQNYSEHTPEGKYHIREYTLEETEHHLKKAGFNVLEKEHFGITDGNFFARALLRFVYLYPSLRNYFLIIGKK